MGKRKGKTFETVAPKKESNIIGTIKGIDIFLKREGRVNIAMNPEIASHRHKSKKDYNRKREKNKSKDFEN